VILKHSFCSLIPCRAANRRALKGFLVCSSTHTCFGVSVGYLRHTDHMPVICTIVGFLLLTVYHLTLLRSITLVFDNQIVLLKKYISNKGHYQMKSNWFVEVKLIDKYITKCM